MIIGIDASRALRARRTGTERYALEIIRHLLALPDAATHRWRLYVDAAPPLTFFGPPAAHVAIVHLPRQRLWTHRALARAVRQDPPDLLFVPAHVVPFAPACLWRTAGCLPSVVTIHDLGYQQFPQAYTWVQRLYLPLSTRWSVHAAHAVIAVSQATAVDLQTAYRVPAANVTVIHEAVAAPASPTGPTDAIGPERTGLPPRYGLYVGTLQPRKNLPRVLQAYAQLRQRQLIDWSLVLAGAPGPHTTALRALVQQLQIAPFVHFLGYVAEDALPALYRGAQLFLFPSLFEGFGLPVLEAQSYGVPVMCANNSSLPEIAGAAALLVEPTDVEALADAMLRLSEDEALRQQLIAAGYENVKRFSWEKAARETMAVFAQVHQRTGARR